MQRRASLFILGGLMAVCLTGCQHNEEGSAEGPPVASRPAPGTGKGGMTATSAPALGLNPEYNGPAVGSKGK